ncbi:inactive protein tyrosine kinase pTKL-like [Bactrocera neohumeralis]|uniref:inactive protein tyrosine kinase pTKL-like n=1 Tax=Bactrocera neohumeralis TaxID=98809 RepID=UPI0021650355|nr:inactive protein tyrosine kinase pTKL-like [Bactrocera neohumeralis]
MEKQKYKKRNLWSDRAEALLIELWQNKISALRGPRKNNHIEEEMAMELQQQGVHFTASEIKSKMHNLSLRYKKEKTAVGSTGGSPSQWPLYEKMRAVLLPYVSYNTESLVEESFQCFTGSEPLQISVETAAPSTFVAASPLSSPVSLPSPSAMPMSPTDSSSLTISSPEPSDYGNKKRNHFQSLILKKCERIEKQLEKANQQFNETCKNIMDITEQFLENDNKKTQLMEEYLKDSKETNKRLLEFLNK